MCQGRDRAREQEDHRLRPVRSHLALATKCPTDAYSPANPRKRTIQATPEFDFCTDIVAGVADPITEEVGEDGQPLKKKRAPRKPKAKEGDDDDAAPTGEDAPKPKRKRAPAKPKVAKPADDAPAESAEEPPAADEPAAEDTSEPAGADKVPGEEDYSEDEDEPMDD